jgi:hypothetical protein
VVDLRRRPGQAVLLLVTLTIATFTLGTAMALRGIGDGPWDRVWRATNGPHVGFLALEPNRIPVTRLGSRTCGAAQSR